MRPNSLLWKIAKLPRRPDGADLNGAALIEEIEGEEAEITDVIDDDEDDE
jgi:hypothetical protein